MDKIIKEVDLTDKVPKFQSKGLEEYSDSMSNEVVKNIKLNVLSNIDINDFSDFNTKEYSPDFGTYIFSVEQIFLKEATKILRISSQGINSNIKITLMEDKIKLSVFNQTTFSEVVLPLVKPLIKESLEDIKGREAFFIINQDLMYKIANEFSDSEIEFKFNAEKSILEVISDNTKLELGTCLELIPDYHSKMSDIVSMSSLNIDVFKDAIKYISYFVLRNNVNKNLSMAMIKQNYLSGGSFSSVGIYKSSTFSGIELKIKYENLGVLSKILPYFNETNTHLFETSRFYILRDENIYFGFDKTCFNFPPIDKFLQAELSNEKIIIPRERLLNGLNRLSIISRKDNPNIKIEVCGLCDMGELKLIIKDQSGRISIDIIDIKVEHGTEDKKEFNINFDTFMKVIDHFNSESVCLKYIEGKALLVIDESKKYKAMSNFSLLENRK